MIHPWIFGGSILTGGGLMAFALTVQGPKPPLPSLEPSPAAVRVVPPEPISVVEPASTVLELPEVQIAGRAKRVVRTAAVPAPEVEPAPLLPCSDWRELGPTHVAKGSATETVSVRELCR